MFCTLSGSESFSSIVPPFNFEFIVIDEVLDSIDNLDHVIRLQTTNLALKYIPQVGSLHQHVLGT